MDIRAAPTVNRLVVIAHNAEIPALVSQQFHEHILRIVRILIFVHHDILEALAVHIQHGRMVNKQFQRFDEKVVKIQGIERFQARFVLDEDRVNLLTAEWSNHSSGLISLFFASEILAFSSRIGSSLSSIFWRFKISFSTAP